MTKEQIIQLLEDFDYKKNKLEDTIEFLVYMTNELIKIQERSEK